MKGKKALLAGAIFVSSILAYNCGGGGGGELTSTPSIGLTATATATPTSVSSQSLTTLETDQTNSQTSVEDVYITLYRVELCSNDGTCTTIFENQNGIEIDLEDLDDDDSVFVIPATGVAPGDYTLKVEIGNTVRVKENGSETPYTICDNNTCTYETSVTITGSDVYVAFEYRTDNGFQLELKPIQQQPSNFDYYEVYGLLQSVDTNDNTITFEWNGNTYTAKINENTICALDSISYGYACASALSTNTCLELKLDSNPAWGGTPGIFIIELAEQDDCGYPKGEIGDSYDSEGDNYNYQHRYEYEDMYVSFEKLQQCAENNNCHIYIGNYQCSIPEGVFCEIETPQMETEGVMNSGYCINQIEQVMNGNGSGMGNSMDGMDMDNGMGNGMMGGMMEIEVKYRIMNGMCEIYKIEAELEDDYEHDDYYENMDDGYDNDEDDN